jgi:hypothetical protein
MNTAIKRNVEIIVRNIESGIFSSSDVATLFIQLRPLLKTKGDTSPTEEISNFIAHPEGRNRGVTSEHCKKFVDHFYEVMSKGGVLEVKHVFTRLEVVADLKRRLSSLGIDSDFEKNSDALMQRLGDVIDEVPIALEHHSFEKLRIQNLRIEGDVRVICLCFTNKVTLNWNNTIPPGMTFAFPAFE